MLVPRLIERKRDGGSLSDAEWRELIAAHVRAEVPDYQMSALLMAIYFRGLSEQETFALTGAMLESGERLDLSALGAPAVDKHSTGGVGDKVSLVLAPLVSALGVAVPMMCGRGLGHTGGTVDKVESIPGFATELTPTAARDQLQRIGCVIMGQSARIAPADAKLYALRDTAGSTECIPLIAASIMSKKLAEDVAGLVLDVKFGSGALIPETDRGAELARLMRAIGEQHGCQTIALQTSMEAPLGRAVGNALEVEEAVHALRAESDAPADLLEVTYALGSEMLLLGGRAQSREEARAVLEGAIRSGAAADQFARIIEAQGGNAALLDDPAILPQANECEVFRAPHKGFITRVAPRVIGHALTALGGGRTSLNERIDPAVGFMVTVKPGDWVDGGEAIASIFARDGRGIEVGKAALSEAISIEAERCAESVPLVLAPER